MDMKMIGFLERVIASTTDIRVKAEAIEMLEKEKTSI